MAPMKRPSCRATPTGFTAAPKYAAAEEEVPWPKGARSARPERFYRWYAVWTVPDHDWLHGVVRVEDPGGWESLAAYLPRQQYLGSGARLRRASSEAHALELYASEARRHNLATKTQIWHLPLRTQ